MAYVFGGSNPPRPTKTKFMNFIFDEKYPGGLLIEYKTEFGFINFTIILDEKYPSGLLLFMGSYIYKEHRRKGKFKEMVNELFSQFKGAEVQVTLSNKHLISFFESLGFEKTGSIEYWRKPKNSTNLKGKI
jgi:hypothetical protein